MPTAFWAVHPHAVQLFIGCPEFKSQLADPLSIQFKSYKNKNKPDFISFMVLEFYLFVKNNFVTKKTHLICRNLFSLWELVKNIGRLRRTNETLHQTIDKRSGLFAKLCTASFSTAPNLLRDAAKYNKGQLGQSHKLKYDQAPDTGQVCCVRQFRNLTLIAGCNHMLSWFYCDGQEDMWSSSHNTESVYGEKAQEVAGLSIQKYSHWTVHSVSCNGIQQRCCEHAKSTVPWQNKSPFFPALGCLSWIWWDKKRAYREVIQR